MMSNNLGCEKTTGRVEPSWGTGMLLSSDHVLSADMGRWRLLRGNSVVVRNSEGSCCRSSMINMINPTELL